MARRKKQTVVSTSSQYADIKKSGRLTGTVPETSPRKRRSKKRVG